MRGELPDDYESALTEQFEKHFTLNPGATFIDAGAHHGTWTLRLAPRFNYVVAFEPHPESRAALSYAAPNNVAVVPHALSEVIGLHTLCLYDTPGHSALEGFSLLGIEPTGSIDIRTTTIDYWVEKTKIKKVDLIKIDTEGHELEVLKGARETIYRHTPKLCIENHSLELRELTLTYLKEDLDVHDVRIWPDESRRHPTEGGYLIRL